LRVNGAPVSTQVEPRTHLADFLREHLRLTGTHLGCEHGVCGACTVLIDGQPARACITYAVACDGLDVRTIEGFDDDAAMAELREAFSREHGLQCGFCTPGMLISSRDIVLRVPDADDKRIRVELSGNLCRCTGYLGIVKAVRGVIEARRGSAEASTAPSRLENATPPALPTFAPSAAVSPAAAVAVAIVDGADAGRKGWHRFEESFMVAAAPTVVWQTLSDVPKVAACIPGAELAEYDGNTVKGAVNVKLGPMAAAFTGSAVIERDDAALAGRIKGAGSDGGTRSRTRGEASYRLVPESNGQRTKVEVVVEYDLQGPLAQFSRSGLAQELGRRIVADFARNLNARIVGGAALSGSAPMANQFDAGGAFFGALWQWLKGLFMRR
ncbi:MAG: 2Fe-2S iron-sulfur cluster binding domain-containing protein, partial [Alphaproteobacteria bacterium]|nr:2Fe-2S iron-sulfur cluster binding domain-containing protein [Alphaproteobacteria bacterium]